MLRSKTAMFLQVLIFGVWSLITSAYAAEDINSPWHPMRIAIIREAEHQCEPTCPEWIYAFGSIEPTTPALLSKVFRQMGNRRLPIIIESQGGDLEAGIKMGRMIRKRGLNVAVGHTRFEVCRPELKSCKPLFSRDIAFAGTAVPERANCDSACQYVLAGGTRRIASPYNYLGLHKPFKPNQNAEKAIARVKPMLKDFFSDMNVDPTIVDLAYASVKMTDLTSQQATDFRLITEPGDVFNLMSVDICKQVPSPDNCITRTVQ
jgi:hypothetical protein